MRVLSEENRPAVLSGGDRLAGMSNARIFRYFKSSPRIIRLAVMMYVRYPLWLRNVKDLRHERGIDITHETVRFWRNRFGTIFAAEIRRSQVQARRHFQHRRWQRVSHLQPTSDQASAPSLCSCEYFPYSSNYAP